MILTILLAAVLANVAVLLVAFRIARRAESEHMRDAFSRAGWSDLDPAKTAGGCGSAAFYTAADPYQDTETS